MRLRGLREWEGVRFIGEAPMPRGEGFPGKGRILGRLWHRALPDERGTGRGREVLGGRGRVGEVRGR